MTNDIEHVPPAKSHADFEEVDINHTLSHSIDMQIEKAIVTSPLASTSSIYVANNPLVFRL